MTAKEKAIYLVEYFITTDFMESKLKGKQCALICVNEVIDDRSKRGKINFTYWKEVEKEINKL